MKELEHFVQRCNEKYGKEKQVKGSILGGFNHAFQ